MNIVELQKWFDRQENWLKYGAQLLIAKADLNEEIVKLSKTYESDGEYVDLLISEIFVFRP